MNIKKVEEKKLFFDIDNLTLHFKYLYLKNNIVTNLEILYRAKLDEKEKRQDFLGTYSTFFCIAKPLRWKSSSPSKLSGIVN